MNALRNWFAGSRRSVRQTRSTRLGFEQLESRQLLSGSPASVGAAIINNVVGSQSSNPQYITSIGQVSYFTADDGKHGRELWRTDGTLTGTSLVKDINPGKADS